MKASKLIEELQRLIDKEGDLPVIFWHEDDYSLYQCNIHKLSIFEDCFQGKKIQLN